METVEHSGITIDRCTRCQGIWFDARERERLLEAKGSESIDVGDVLKGRELNQLDRIECPRCKTRMVRMVDRDQPHIWFEQCAACGGSFFDAGEFRDLKEQTFGDFFRSLFGKARG